MSEDTAKKKRVRKTYNLEVKKPLMATYKVSEPFFNMAMSGSRSSDRAIKIKEEYQRLTSALKITLERIK